MKLQPLINGSWICVYAYMVDFWTRFFLLFCVERIVDGFGSNNFIEVIMVALLKVGG
jgi:hypothetical protein